jgi:hypothetical protein
MRLKPRPSESSLLPYPPNTRLTVPSIRRFNGISQDRVWSLESDSKVALSRLSIRESLGQPIV